MKIGIIGLGKMGTAIARRLYKDSHELIFYDLNPIASKILIALINAKVADDLAILAQNSEIIWMMLPAGKPVEETILNILPYLKPGTIIIDGGNSYYKDTIKNSEILKTKEAYLLDCGTSGGIYGAEHGFSLTIGGEFKAFEQAENIFKALSVPHGYMYAGPSGAGHYIKMIHNGIEYGIMQAYSEGINLLHSGYYTNLDLGTITCTWKHGAVIRSFILKLLDDILDKDTEFSNILGIIDQTGTGKWTVQEALERNIPVPAIETALNVRFSSQLGNHTYSTKLLAVLRNKLGGHYLEKIDETKICVTNTRKCLLSKGHNKFTNPINKLEDNNENY